jgi:signal transduction histidine kinase
MVEDDGPGVDLGIRRQMFKQRVKGRDSKGNGFGLAFVEAVVRAHGGTVTASKRLEGGAQILITWLLAKRENVEAPHAVTLVDR